MVEIKNGKKVTVERKLYPGYVLVEMAMSQEAQHLVNSIQGVIKFVGTGRRRSRCAQEEVNRLLGIAEAVTEADAEGRDSVHGGPGGGDHRGAVLRFQRHGGGDAGRQGQGQVSVSLFGRPTTVEMDYLQLRGH